MHMKTNNYFNAPEIFVYQSSNLLTGNVISQGSVDRKLFVGGIKYKWGFIYTGNSMKNLHDYNRSSVVKRKENNDSVRIHGCPCLFLLCIALIQLFHWTSTTVSNLDVTNIFCYFRIIYIISFTYRQLDWFQYDFRPLCLRHPTA